MKRLSKIFMVLAVMLVSAFGAMAQSMDDMAKEVVASMAQELNSPAMKQEMMKEGELSAFSASASGNVLILNMTSADKSVNFRELSAAEKKELTSQFGDFMKQGLAGSDVDGQVAEMLRMLGVKIRIKMNDSYGNTITSDDISF